MSTTTPQSPDRWSLESWFSGFGKPDYTDFKAALVRDVEALKFQAAALGGETAGILRSGLTN